MNLAFRIGKQKTILKTLADYIITFTGVNLYEMPKAEYIDLYFLAKEDFEDGLEKIFTLVEKREKKDVLFEVITSDGSCEFYGKPILWGTGDGFCNVRIQING